MPDIISMANLAKRKRRYAFQGMLPYSPVLVLIYCSDEF